MATSTLLRGLTPTSRAVESGGRLAWLDALRGVAALVVAFHHSSYYFLADSRMVLAKWFDPGTYGVMLFFLVSGYIVPASIERSGSLRRFWTGRIFRIYPLMLAAAAVVLVLSVTGVYPVRADLADDNRAGAVLAHATMLQDLLATPNMINIQWTLSYEMAFYLLVAALFVAGLHLRSATVAGGFAVASAVASAVTLATTAVLSRWLGVEAMIALAASAFAAAVCGMVQRDPRLRWAGAVVGGVLALTLLVLNGRVWPDQGFLILAVMFLGTAIHRAERGQVGKGPVAAAALAVIVAVLLIPGTPYKTGALLAGLTFAAAMAVRHRAFPKWLVWLGGVSYSVYVIHPLLLIGVALALGGGRVVEQPLAVAGFLIVLLPLAALTHRYIELPGRRLGRRVTGKASPART